MKPKDKKQNHASNLPSDKNHQQKNEAEYKINILHGSSSFVCFDEEM